MTTSTKTGGSVDYYTCSVAQARTIDGRPGYDAQCLEIIETLGMSFAEGEAFKAIWRSCAARTLGKVKADCDALYNAEKVAFYGQRMVVEAGLQEKAPVSLRQHIDKLASRRRPLAGS